MILFAVRRIHHDPIALQGPKSESRWPLRTSSAAAEYPFRHQRERTKGQHEAKRYLKHRLGEIEGEKHGGHAFIGAKHKRITVNDLLDSLQKDYATRKVDNPQFKSHLKRIRAYFGTWKAVEVSDDSIKDYIIEMREDEYFR